MLLITFFIVGFGMCAGKREDLTKKERLSSTQIYKRSLKMLRTKDPLRLHTFSKHIEGKIPKCLISRFIKTKEKGAVRTLETNYKLETKEKERKIKETQLNLEVAIAITNGSIPYLQITFQKGSHDAMWTYAQDLKYAKPKGCIILQDTSGEGLRPACTLWGYKHTVPKQMIKCQKIFLQLCGAGRVVDPTQCTEGKEKKGTPVKEPK
uniref:Putative secreted protein 94 n=1 Tax=Amblyomma cajennense TaxID=34607 RepID=A0A023FU80_AMBCJ